jgi:hypothetical protein
MGAKIIIISKENDIFLVKIELGTFLKIIDIFLKKKKIFTVASIKFLFLNISSEVLLKIIEFCINDKAKGDVINGQLNNSITLNKPKNFWQDQFFKINFDKLLKIVLNSSFLGVEKLLLYSINLISKTIIKKNINKIKTFLGS